jgi:hypothetical protein
VEREIQKLIINSGIKNVVTQKLSYIAKHKLPFNTSL